MLVFLRCCGEAVVAQGLRGPLGLVPFGERLYDIAADAIDRYRKAKREAQIGADVERVVRADMEEVRAEARQIAREVAAGRPEADIAQLESYLTQVRSHDNPSSGRMIRAANPCPRR